MGHNFRFVLQKSMCSEAESTTRLSDTLCVMKYNNMNKYILFWVRVKLGRALLELEQQRRELQSLAEQLQLSENTLQR